MNKTPTKSETMEERFSQFNTTQNVSDPSSDTKPILAFIRSEIFSALRRRDEEIAEMLRKDCIITIKGIPSSEGQKIVSFANRSIRRFAARLSSQDK